MGLPNLEFTNNFWELGVEEQTLLYTKSVSNNLIYYPGYNLNLTLSRLIRKDKFTYRRQQSISGFLPGSVRIAARLQGNYITGVLSFKSVTMNYVQNNPQINTTDISQSILDTGKFKGMGIYDLWDATDRWYINEESLYAPFGIEYAGQPTTIEKALVASSVLRSSDENGSGGSGGSSGYHSTSTVTSSGGSSGHHGAQLSDRGNPNFDYRPYRPLIAPLNKDTDLPLVQEYSDNQVTIETILTPVLKYVLSGEQLFKSISSHTYQSSTIPRLMNDPQAEVKATVANFLTDLTPYIVK